MTLRRTLLTLALAAPVAARAQPAWPARPLRIVVPFAPGGSTDLMARRIAERLTQTLGQTVLVENRPGAGGVTGSDLVAKSPPDGLTLLFGVTGTHAIAPSLYPALPYQPLRDFAPVTLVVQAPLVLVVHPALPIHSMAEFIAAAKARPGAISYGTPGNGTSMHLTGVMFDQAAGTQTTHVPYRGSAVALNDLVGGTLSSMWGDLLVVLPQIRAGAIRALAVTSATRNPLLPEVPTVAESGLPGFEAVSWQGLFAPAATPPDLVERLSNEVRAALALPEIHDFFAGQGFLVGGTTPAAFTTMVGAEMAKWARVVHEGHVSVE